MPTVRERKISNDPQSAWEHDALEAAALEDVLREEVTIVRFESARTEVYVPQSLAVHEGVLL